MNATYEYMNETSIDPELICSICQSPLIDPHCTPCSETFCYECITKWIETKNASCPHCRQDLSMSTLTQAPRSLRNMLDRLPVKCVLCEDNELKRANFNEHIQQLCPKTVVSCPSADIKCLWTGQRDQLNQHLATCCFEAMRPVIIELIGENKQLKDQVNQQIIQITGQENDIRQLREQLGWEITQKIEIQNENQRLLEQVEQLKTQVTTCLAENQQLNQQLREKHIQTASISSQSFTQVATTRDITKTSSGVEALKGSWDYVDSENFDDYLKEIGVGWATRMTAKGLKPRLVISENNGKWTVRSESTLKTISVEFTPGVEFNEITLDGREVTSTINFEGDKWVHTSIDKNGKKYVVTRYVDDNGQHMMNMECGSVKARRWYKRTE